MNLIKSNHKSKVLKLNSSFNTHEEWIRWDGTKNENDKIVFYGEKNDHPDVLRQYQEKSLQHSNIISLVTNLISGEIRHRIKGKDEMNDADEKLIKKLEEKYEEWRINETHHERAYLLYAYGGCPVLLFWNVGATKEQNEFFISQRPFTEFRLGTHVNTMYGMRPKYHYYHYFWSYIKDARLVNQKIKSAKTYFNNGKIRKDWTLRMPVFYEKEMKVTDTRSGSYSYLIQMPKKTNKFYPKPFWESEVVQQKIDSEHELAVLERGTIKRGLRADHIVNVYRAIYDRPEGDIDVMSQQEEDTKAVEQRLAGFDNAGTVVMNFIGLQNGNIEEAKITDGHIEILPIPSNNNHEEFKSRKQGIYEDIRSAHAFVVPQMAGLSDTSTGFSNMGEYILYGSEMYINNVVKPHIEKLNDFYTNVINANNGYPQVETFITPTVPIMKALIKEFRDCLTCNEIREDVFGKGPMAKEDAIGQTTEKLAKELFKRING